MKAMSPENRIYLLFGKKMAGSITEKELRELAELIWQHPELHYSLELLAAVWDQRAKENLHISEAAYKRHWNRMNTVQKNINHHVNFISMLKKYFLSAIFPRLL